MSSCVDEKIAVSQSRCRFRNPLGSRAHFNSVFPLLTPLFVVTKACPASNQRCLFSSTHASSVHVFCYLSSLL